MKQLQDAIKSVGGQLAQLVADKARAVDDEDYDRAGAIKSEITRIRHSLADKMSEAGLRGGGASGRPHGGPSGGAPDSYYGAGGDRGDDRAIRPAASADGPGGEGEEGGEGSPRCELPPLMQPTTIVLYTDTFDLSSWPAWRKFRLTSCTVRIRD